MLEGKKIITPQEMQRIEALAFAQGHSDSQFMDQASKRMAALTEAFIQKNSLGKVVYILAGKGNNGGDAYATGIQLLARHFNVVAFQFFPKELCSSLCQNRLESFQKYGGRVVFLHKNESLSFPEKGIILDGLLGTGFQGKVEGMLADVILEVNKQGLPILAIDIPSGVNGTTGEVLSVAIQATQTFYLGLPKIGFFLEQGLNHTGSLIDVDFGLSDLFIKEAKAEGYLLDETQITLPRITPNQHKYERGYVLGLAGSEEMGGAASLSSLGALRGGAGIVRLFYSQGMNLSMLPMEVIREAYDKHRILEECTRASSLFIGPGLGKGWRIRRLLRDLLPQILQPVVIDADALFFLAENPETKLPFYSILTPHKKEMQRLLQGKACTLSSCQEFADHKNVTLVLKGMPTIVFHPHVKPLFIPRGDAGMATAGSGDILTGIIAALLAQKVEPLKAAKIGVYLHALAGEFAAKGKTSYCMIASDILDYLPLAFQKVLSKG
jgi:NAD(P)H-hydrate epimerase